MEYKKGSVLKRRIYAVYSHMGIFDGRQVYHFHKKGKRFSIVHTDLQDFADGKKVTVHLEPEDDRHAEKIIERAREAYGNKKWDNNYSLGFLNCEDFVGYCYGRGRGVKGAATSFTHNSDISDGFCALIYIVFH